jgi:hypothetical protein
MVPGNFSVYGVNLERRMLDKALYVVDSNDIPFYLLQPVLLPFL